MGATSIIGGATGFGAALIATPLMLLIGFPLPQVIVLNLTVALVTRIAIAVQLRRNIQWRRVGLLGLGSVPGSWLGAATVTSLPMVYFQPAVGILVMLCGVAMMLPTSGKTYTPSTLTLTLTGGISGYLGTTTSLNGPPPALLLMRARLPPLTFIADLAGFFIIANTAALAIMWMANAITLDMVWPSLPVLLSTALVGNSCGIWIARKMTSEAFRFVTISLVIASGALAVLHN
ncbi:sulfite exporter TauE/SafE family protein [Rhodococcus sp. MS13]|uniref:sulfite exporter TauE/SafE family protein n=1 Tax=Rhodococcus sp. MS13 TaxID=2579940 RepID=UPI001F5BEA79|nr:sulfite exporter TauE/SafE family protein [Rhodococcus sp. MS13]